jgi:hypothetical protein
VGTSRKDGGGMKVYIAMYRTGYTNTPSEIIAVCASHARAITVLETHKETRNRTFEYRDHADWWVDEKEVVE